MATSTLQPSDTSAGISTSTQRRVEPFFSRLFSGPAIPWNWKTLLGLVALLIMWAAWMHGTWETWGWLTADCGREMYVPAALSEGKTLYSDIWYPYGPLAPYLNAFLFRIFGVHLSVLYWMGSLSALGSALLLYFSGMRMSSPLAGWTAGGIVLAQSFQHSLFSFPLPYSFASVYGCLTACSFLWLMIQAASSENRWWVFGAGTAAAVALLLKLEMGIACYLSLTLLIAVRAIPPKSWTFLVKDIVACLPGLAACGAVLFWMISLGGVEFLTQENISSWPTSFFMRTYGKYWLERAGFALNGGALAQAAARTLILLGVFQGVHLLWCWRRTARKLILLRIVLFIGSTGFFASYLHSTGEMASNSIILVFQETLRYLFFPQDMVLYAAVAAIAAWLYFWRQRTSTRSAAIPLCFSFASLFAFRILLKATPWGYSIYYDGPAVLSLLVLGLVLITERGRTRRFRLSIEGMICALALTTALVNMHRQVENPFPRTTRLTTERGSILLSQETAEQYKVAIKFMKEQKHLGADVLSVPEDTGLYFFSETDCPVRVFVFVPGVVAPGKMTDEVIQQIEKKPVRYLIWSNRLFPEYNAMRFGVDFDQTLGQYLLSHYHRVRPLTQNHVPMGEWTGFIWERNPEAKSNDRDEASHGAP